jgi:hypothetical protein
MFGNSRSVAVSVIANRMVDTASFVQPKPKPAKSPKGPSFAPTSCMASSK